MSDSISRYHRQQLLKEFGVDSEVVFAKAKVAIIGMGGLGCPVAQQLAGAGIGKLLLVDPDQVSLTNLHRQTLYSEEDVGELKVEAAKKRLQNINHEISISIVSEACTLRNVQELLQGVDVVVDAGDSFFLSYVLSDTCFDKKLPLVSASVLGTSGYLGVYCGGSSVSLRAVFPAPSSIASDCNSVGVSGPSCSVIGSLQAHEVFKILLHDPATLYSKLLTLDLWTYQQNLIDVSSAKEPDLKAQLISTEDIDLSTDTIIDVRTPEEALASPLVVDTVNVPLNEIDQHLEQLAKDMRLVCVCSSGQRALSAAHRLCVAGFTQVAVAH